MFSLYEALQSIRGFIEAGGPVLYGIAGLTFFMWMLVFERIWYFRFGLHTDIAAVVRQWETRAERQSWQARQIRRALLARTRAKIDTNLGLIKVCVSLCPLLGLLGTVTGMVVVFHVMAVTADPKPNAKILVAVNSANQVWIDKKQLDPRIVKLAIERMHAENPKGALVVQADAKASTRVVAAVLDAARDAGIEDISVSTTKK